MTRLAITKKVLRDIGIRSKNRCAFPGCDHLILNENGEYIAELCHIEAAERGGPRFNPSQTDEERRSIENLLFLCHQHHNETDNEEIYTVDRLKQMKLPAASGRGIKEDNINFIPSPYPSPQGEGTSDDPTASGWGIEKS